MTLGAINGISIESILQRIPDANLRTAYRASLEHFSSAHPGLLENPERLARYLNSQVSQGGAIDYQSLSVAVGRGLLHADEYVAASYLLASASSQYSVSNGLFRINPLWAEHLIYLQEQESSYAALRRASFSNQVEMLTLLRDATGVSDGVLEYLQYFDSLPQAARNTWSALETYRDHGVQTNFLDLRQRVEYPEEFYRNHVAHLNAFEVEDLKPEIVQTGIRQCREEVREEPPCAPNDPSCEN